MLSAKEAARVACAPLGSAENPVRAHMPAGQHAYLRRLRCPDGTAPQFRRLGSVGLSPYGSMMDVYEIVCGESLRRTIHMDMYHPGYIEERAIEGFSIEPPGP